MKTLREVDSPSEVSQVKKHLSPAFTLLRGISKVVNKKKKSKLRCRQIYSAEVQSNPDSQAWIKAVGRHEGTADERGTH